LRLALAARLIVLALRWALLLAMGGCVRPIAAQVLLSVAHEYASERVEVAGRRRQADKCNAPVDCDNSHD
jgi:hypothetical protein